jgi:hypothetical protein
MTKHSAITRCDPFGETVLTFRRRSTASTGSGTTK